MCTPLLNRQGWCGQLTRGVFLTSGYLAGGSFFFPSSRSPAAVVPGPVPHGHKKSRPKAASLAGCAAAQQVRNT